MSANAESVEIYDSTRRCHIPVKSIVSSYALTFALGVALVTIFQL